MVWLEVETKAIVKDPGDMRKRIRKIANFTKKEKRGDDYFAIKQKGYPKKAFRIRNTKTTHVVNFKKRLKEYYDDYIVVKQEFEFELTDKEQMENFLALLKDLKFEEWIKKLKTSESYKHKKDKRLIIELNKVKHLGYFLEIEYLCQEKEMKKAKKKIMGALKELGVKKKDIDNTGYTKRLYDKGIKDKKFFIKW
ncbi:MAG: class IV adenylate cyclase [Candidatus Woesearchaeota archaeon]